MTQDLLELANMILSEYHLVPGKVRLIQSGEIKTVWKIEAGDTSYCLKRLRHNLEKSIFSIKAQRYMAEQGAKVPPIFMTRSQELYEQYQGQVFVLYKWIKGRQLNLRSTSDLRAAVKGLAEFHLASKGYTAPAGIRISTKLGRWPHQYQSMLERLVKWKISAADNLQNRLCAEYLSRVDYFIQLAHQVIELLNRSFYREWAGEIQAQKMLCHQDYGEGNALLTEKGIFVLDLDGVTYELPARDLRKIVLKTMLGCGHWNEKLLRLIISWYEEVNPLSAAQKKVLYIDLLFPHEFHNLAKNPFHKQKKIKPEDLIEVARIGREKVKILERMLAE